MSTPTDQQQIRATLRRAERNVGSVDTALMVVAEARGLLGIPACVLALEADGVIPPFLHLPDLMGTAEVAAAFGIANSNISKLPPAVRPIPCQRISNGTTPVYLASEVMAKAAQYRPRTRA